MRTPPGGEGLAVAGWAIGKRDEKGRWGEEEKEEQCGETSVGT